MSKISVEQELEVPARPGLDHKDPSLVTEPKLGAVPEYDPSPRRQSKGAEVMKYVISVLILGAGIAVAAGLSLLKEPPANKDSKELIPMVGTFKTAEYSGTLEMTVSGTVVPFREVRVAAEVSGNVIKKHELCEAGVFVKKGTKLIEIDPTDYNLQLQTREAEVAQSQKMLEETEEEMRGAARNLELAQNDYDLTKSEFDRNQRIQNALSESELDQSKRSLLNAQTALTGRQNSVVMLEAKKKRMEAALALAKANLNRAKLSVQKTVIVAPDDGVIVRESVQEGDFVRAGDPLLVFEDIRKAEVICNLAPSDIKWVRDNSPASAEFDQASQSQHDSVYYLPKTRVSVFEPEDERTAWDGILERFNGNGRDETTRAIPCQILVDKPIIDSKYGKRALVRGMYVKCKIQVPTSTSGSDKKFLYFPAAAYQPGGYVWVVRDKKVYRVDVEVVNYATQLVGDKEIPIVVVHEGEETLKANDVIVTTPLAQPTNGMEILLDSEFDKSKMNEPETKSAEKTAEKE